MKQFLLLAIAVLGLSSCAEKMSGSDSSDTKAEFEKSYISVILKTDDASTRASDNYEFEEGEAHENHIENIHFFLFKSDGSAFPVNGVSGRNYRSVTVEGSSNEETDSQILSFNNPKGEYPGYIVAVLNWDARNLQPSYTLDNLYNAVAPVRNSNNHFVMSNSIYADMQGNVVKATSLMPENICKSEEEAEEKPVKIYVERISAKVEVVAKGDVAGKTATYDTGESINGQPVHVKVLKWELYNNYNHSIVLKHIYPETWGMTDEIGFLWNDPNRFRSYWAGSYTGNFPTDNSFNWEDNGLIPGTDVAYCGENTRQIVVDADGKVTSDPRAKVVIKAQLVDADDKPLEAVIWQAHSYIGEQSILNEVAETLSDKIFKKEGGEYIGISGEDLKVVEGADAPAGSGVEIYEVFFQLADISSVEDWYIYTSADGYKKATADAINGELLDVEPALLYRNGMTYYYTDIKHSGSAGSDSEFGVVRNHIYRVNITDISGLGTAVTDPEGEIEVPEHPEEAETFVSAEIRILSWKVVKNDYSVN